MAIRAASVGVFLATLLTHGSARAGCGNVCVMSEPKVTMAAESQCAWAETISNDCGCSVRLVVHNECAAPLDAVNFKFESCRAIGVPATADCTSLAYKTQGDLEMWLSDTGRNERSFHFKQAGQDHFLSVEVDVSAIDDGGMCSIGPLPGRRGAPAFIALACAGLIALVARRRRATRAA